MCDPQYMAASSPLISWPLSSEAFGPSKQHNLRLIPIILKTDVERELFERSHYRVVARVRVVVEASYLFPET